MIATAPPPVSSASVVCGTGHSLRVLEAAAMFGVDPDEPRSIGARSGANASPLADTPCPPPAFPAGGVVLVTGPSGGGKSTLLRRWARDLAGSRRVLRLDGINLSLESTPIDLIDAPLEAAMATLARAGLGEARAMLTPSSMLSDGQRHRLRLAIAMNMIASSFDSRPAVLLADEFGSMLDRRTALTLARCTAAWARSAGTTLVAATAHDDLDASLDPEIRVHVDLDGRIDIRRDRRSRRRARLETSRSVQVEEGTLDDYRALARWHYRAGAPATVDRVLRAVHRTNSIAGRYLHRRGESRLAGVLVRSHPTLLCRARDAATDGRYRGLTLAERAIIVNREFRTISRVIVDPRDRGLGLASALVRQAIAEAPTPCIEALAAMGHAHPFFEQAGMVRFDVPPSPAEARLHATFEDLGIPTFALASRRGFRSIIECMPAAHRDRLEREVRRWAASDRDCRARGLARLTLDDLVDAARTRALVRPVYYLAGPTPSGATDDAFRGVARAIPLRTGGSKIRRPCHPVPFRTADP